MHTPDPLNLAFEILLHRHATPTAEKVAWVSGHHEPSMDHASIPYEIRKKRYLAYAKEKSREGPTSYGRAMLTGGGVGAALGALGAGAPGAVIGGATGAAVGAMAKSYDDRAIDASRRLVRGQKDVDDHIAERIVRQSQDKDEARWWDDERRHQMTRYDIRRS